MVPDSGTGALAGLAGTMTLTIADGKHSFVLEYTLDDPKVGTSDPAGGR